MPAQRDPVSETMDRAARALLDRVYRAGGGWAATRLADPSAAQLAWWIMHGINVRGRDPVPGGAARTRWGRAFIRALNHQHKWWSGDPDTGGWRETRRASWRRPGIQAEIGRHRPLLGVIPAGYTVRVRLGDPKAKIKPGEEWADGGPRWADPADRDWG